MANEQSINAVDESADVQGYIYVHRATGKTRVMPGISATRDAVMSWAGYRRIHVWGRITSLK